MDVERDTPDSPCDSPEDGRDGAPEGGRRPFPGGSGAKETDAGMDMTLRLYSSGATLLESVGLSRMIDSVEVKTVPLSGATRQRGL